MLRYLRFLAGHFRARITVSGGLSATMAVILSTPCASLSSRPPVIAEFSATASDVPSFQIATIKTAPRDLVRNSVAHSIVGADEGENEMLRHKVPSPMAV